MKKITFGFLLLSSSFLQAQLSIDNSFTPTELAGQVANGITPLNVTFNRSSANATAISDQISKFNSAPENNIGFDDGIILTTGKTLVAVGPNNTSQASYPPSNTIVGDADLALLTQGAVKNIAAWEFDFTATGNELNLEYIFASEEYPEYVGSSFNDAFGILISGPGINGSFSNNAVNIAKIPNTTQDVSIWNINHVTNSSYYRYNPTNSLTAQYDGYTVPLTATAALISGETYHIKIAIANVGDNTFDSGLFLKTGSLTTTNRLATANFAGSSFKLYPNPAKNIITISSGSPSDSIQQVTINDIMGKQILQWSNIAGQETSLDVAHLGKGIYLVEIISQNDRAVKKLVLE